MAFRAIKSKTARGGLTVETVNGFAGFGAAAERSLRKTVEETLEAAALAARDSILNGPKSGAFYGDHQASAPGEAPANDDRHSGEHLADTIKPQMTGRLSGEVIATAPHAAVLEFGGVHVAPRPFLGPAIEQAKGELGEAVRDALHEALS